MKNLFKKFAHPSDLIHKKKWYKDYKKIVPLAIVIILIAVGVKAGFGNNQDEITTEPTIKKIQVKTMTVGENLANDTIQTVGLVKADTVVEIVALNGGTVKSINFNVGDEVSANQTLAYLHDSSTLTSLNNAQTNYSNSQSNYNSINLLTNESITQAELGLANAKEAVNAAEVSLQTAQSNYDNGLILQERNNANIKTNAVTSYFNYLSTINNAINQANYILGVDGGQIAGIAATLGAKGQESVQIAEEQYKQTKKLYEQLITNTVNSSNIETNLELAISGLKSARLLIDKTITVLNKTTANADFNESSLTTQKNAFFTLQSSIASTQLAADGVLQNIQNLDILNKQEKDRLNSALETAKSQLEIAKISYANAQTSLDNTTQGKEQQLIGAKTALDNARGQLSLVQSQAGDLNIKSPIKGKITRKYIEQGTDVRTGQKIAEVSQLGLVKIIVNLASTDVYKITLNQNVTINNELTGVVTHIDPSADPQTKKVKIEVAFDNQNKDLITETFVDVSIPVTQTDLNVGSFNIPLKAVTITQSENYVFIVKDDIAKKITVELGETSADQIIINNGLQKGDLLIIEGNKILSGDEPIEIIQ